jgi:hypothetical protein
VHWGEDSWVRTRSCDCRPGNLTTDWGEGR